MFIKNFTLNRFKNLTINFYFFLSLFLAVISFKYIQDWSIQIYFVIYLFITSILLKEKKFNKNNLSLLLNFYTTFFLTIPMSYIIFNNSYIFGSGSLFLPFKQIEYRQSLDTVILKIIFFWLSIWLSIFLTSKKNEEKELFSKNQIPLININILFLIAIIGIIISILTNQNLIRSLNNNINPGFSIFRFLFSDPAIIIYSSILFIYYKNLNENINIKLNNLELKYFIFVSLYLLNFILLGSKAGILVLYLLSFLIILSSLKNLKKINIFFLTNRAIILLIFVMFLTFIGNDIFRSEYYLTKTISLSDLVLIFEKVFSDIYYSSILLFEKILKRLANHGLDQFILINLTFSDYDYEYAKKFSIYIYKNFLNLMLPGTLYPEAYSPSSQLFTDILFKRNLDGDIDTLNLIKNLNTQPFSIFGFFTILFGFYSSLIMVFMYFFCLNLLINKSQDIFFRVVIVFIYYSSFIIYSFESTIALQIQLYFQILFIHLIVLNLNRLLKKIYI